MNILITGSTGFVGKKLVDYLLANTSATLRLAVRKTVSADIDKRTARIPVGDISAQTQWQDALDGCSVVIHAAARVHVMNEQSPDPLAEYRQVNVEGTLNLARQAAAAGVKRFIYLSTIKVNGELTTPGNPFREDDVHIPTDFYALSKYEAEQGLLALARDTGMEVVIIRPVLVYGPGVKGNFASMMKWLDKGIPLPLGLVNNKRSFVSVDNLVDLITTCLTHPRAANQIFLVSDGDDLSTAELLKKLRGYFTRQSILLPVPVWILNGLANALGKGDFSARLCGSLQVDIGKARELLGWQPRFRVNEVLRETTRRLEIS